MRPHHYRVFFDTSAYVAALLSPSGAARTLLKASNESPLVIVLSEAMLHETANVLLRKFPHLIEINDKILQEAHPEIAPSPPNTELHLFRHHLAQIDALLLCTAAHTSVDAFVTWNTKDFMRKEIHNLVNFPIVTPGECLKLFRQWIEPFLH